VVALKLETRIVDHEASTYRCCSLQPT
jgi:hypothetical protein